jgi:pyruvate dehydrogenase E2 component (dihydrolipoamide acetyltransferase)
MDDRNHGAGNQRDGAPTTAEQNQGQGGTVRVDRSLPPMTTAAVNPLPASEVHRIPVSGMRAAIARRMHQSQREVPLFHVEREIRMDRALELCERLRQEGHQVSCGHIFVKAAADSLLAQPDLNARFVGDAIEVLRRIHLAIAIALPEGLIFPVLHDAPGLNLLQTAERTASLRTKAEAKTLAPEDLAGASFTISNLGKRGVERFTTVVHPPQAASLALGMVAPRPVADNGVVRVAATVHATLSCDHRAVDGQQAAAYLEELRRLLEDPAKLLTGVHLGET